MTRLFSALLLPCNTDNLYDKNVIIKVNIRRDEFFPVWSSKTEKLEIFNGE
ncbi:MAG: hypothetical protein ONB42_15525 [candidate division KSB1 bacterium]|nr:hypothetical protein [candidate division KSB1 bacterium]